MDHGTFDPFRWKRDLADCLSCFHLNATGGPGGCVGQLSDGQNRIGQNLPEAQYCINNGGQTTLQFLSYQNLTSSSSD